MVPSLLAVHGQDNQTTCSDSTTYTEWAASGKNFHPRSFGAQEVNAGVQLAYLLQRFFWACSQLDRPGFL